jgi:energy-converting hydrogenase Eha subunit E
MTPEFWAVFFVGAMFVILGSWLVLMAPASRNADPPTLNTRNDRDDPTR